MRWALIRKLYSHGISISWVVLTWKLFLRYRPSVRGIHWSPVDFPYKGLVTQALKFSLMLVQTQAWINPRIVGDLRDYDNHCDVTVMVKFDAIKLHHVFINHLWTGGRFKNAYELVNLRVFKFSLVSKIHIFQCMDKIFCVEFQRVPLKFHTKYLTHTLKDKIFIQYWVLKALR